MQRDKDTADFWGCESNVKNPPDLTYAPPGLPADMAPAYRDGIRKAWSDLHNSVCPKEKVPAFKLPVHDVVKKAPAFKLPVHDPVKKTPVSKIQPHDVVKAPKDSSIKLAPHRNAVTCQTLPCR
ncbi:hypothetical protein [Streptomyces sp. LN785]|uniref:hypothetical protein n=1 Tax=Streptomyces sp. LN785 TaxID=3112983 RepID=UPI0037116EAA